MGKCLYTPGFTLHITLCLSIYGNFIQQSSIGTQNFKGLYLFNRVLTPYFAAVNNLKDCIEV